MPSYRPTEISRQMLKSSKFKKKQQHYIQVSLLFDLFTLHEIHDSLVFAVHVGCNGNQLTAQCSVFWCHRTLPRPASWLTYRHHVWYQLHKNTPIQYNNNNTHTHIPFNGPFSGTTRVSRYQKGKTTTTTTIIIIIISINSSQSLFYTKRPWTKFQAKQMIH